MKSAIDRFVKHLDRVQNRSVHTVQAYQTDVQQFEQVISVLAGWTVMPWNLNDSMIHGYFGWLGEQGYRLATLARKIAAVKAFLAYLQEVEEIDTVQQRALLQSPQAKRTNPRILKDQELQAILAGPESLNTPLGLRDAAILKLLAETGVRASELIDLRLKDLDPYGRLKHPVREDRWVQLDESRVPLQRYIDAGRPHLVKDPKQTALFLNLRGKKLSRQGLWLVVKRWAHAAGVTGTVSPHSLRHTLIDQLVREGKSRRDIQETLGLSSPNAIRVHFRRKEE